MRGLVLEFDRMSNSGLISGDDGRRYRFVAAELRSSGSVRGGDTVDFVPAGDEAREIFVLVATGGSESGVTIVPADRSLWGWFVFVFTMRGEWKGRARRKEYWAFSLFALLILLVACLPLAGYDEADENWGLYLPLVLVSLAMVPGSIKVLIRRLHDVGLSGWFYVATLVPWLGSLFSLIVALLPSQDRTNRWGPPAAPR